MSESGQADPTSGVQSAQPAEKNWPRGDDARLLDLVEQYTVDLRQGRLPDRRRLLAQHPEIASELEECLSAVELVSRINEASPARGD